MKDFLSKDAKRLLEAGEILLQEAVSFPRLANLLSISPVTLRATLTRLNNSLGGEIVVPNQANSDRLVLSELGKSTFERFRQFTSQGTESPQNRNFSVAVSHTMVTSGLLDGVLMSMREFSGSSFDLKACMKMNFNEVLDGIERQSLDFSIVWGIRQRTEKLPAWIRVDKITPEVDVVVVSHDRSIVDIVNSHAHWFNPDKAARQHGAQDHLATAMAELARFRWASLPHDNQIAVELLPSPSGTSQPRRTEVDTIDAAIAFVRCCAADFAVVPAIYDQLEREKQTGKIVFSEPISQIPILLMSHRDLGNKGNLIRSHLFEMLQANRSSASWRTRKTPTDRFPRSASFYRDLKYGYYIGSDAKSDGAPVEWCWESIRLFPEKAGGRNSFTGIIVNQFNARFRVTHAEFRDTFFVAQVARVGRSDRATKDFLSRFHYCDFRRGVICGTWSGNSRHNRPGVFATVWSREKLNLEELSEVTRIADLHSIMSAQHGCENRDEQEDLTLGVDPMAILGAEFEKLYDV